MPHKAKVGGRTSQKQIGKWEREQEDWRELVRELRTEFDEGYREQFLVTKADRKLTFVESADLDRMKSQLLKCINRLNEVDAFLVRDLSEEDEIEVRKEIKSWYTKCELLLSEIDTVKTNYKEYVLSQSQTDMAPFIGLMRQHQQQQQALLETLTKQLADAKTNGNGSNGSKGASVKLPKLEIPQFDGNVMKWEGFWKSFESSVHDNPDVPPITKFAYLKSLLTGVALQTLSGLETTEANYEVAIDLLRQNFGNEEVIIAQHVNSLTYIKPLAPAYTTAQLRAFLDEVEGHVRSLQSAFVLGSDDSFVNRMSFEQIMSKLPFSLRRKLYDKAKNDKNKHTLHFLFTELRSIIQVNQRSEYTPFAEPKGQSQPNGNGFSRKQSSNSRSTTSALLFSSQNGKSGYSQNKPKPKCKFCEEEHWSDKCKKYPTVEARKQFALTNRRCFCCLEEGHVGVKCGRKRPCFFCKQTGHNSALCFKGEKDKGKSPTNVLATTENQPSEATETLDPQEAVGIGILPVAQPGKQSANLWTATFKVRNKDTGKSMWARGVFDTGGQKSFIRTSVSQNLGLKVIRKDKLNLAGFVQPKATEHLLGLVEVEIGLNDGSYLPIKAYAKEVITHKVKRLPISPQKYPQLLDLKLADPLIDQPELFTLDILFGADHCDEFFEFEKSKRLDEHVCLLGSKVGYIVSGKKLVESRAKEEAEVVAFCAYDTGETEFELDKLEKDKFEKFWGLEEMGIKESPLRKTEDELAQEHFDKNVRFIESVKRHEVVWPWKDRKLPLGNNYELALRRLKMLVKRLKENPDKTLLEKYDAIFQEQVRLGIIEEVTPKTSTDIKIYYIPHHCVIRLDKATTKIRIVYNASSKDRGVEFCLNDLLYKGPVGLEDICGLLMRIRTKKIAIVSDIEKAFLQIMIRECDRDVNRLLWLKDLNNPSTGPENIKILRFARVGFGVNASPFLLMAVIRHHLKKHPDCHIAAEISKNLYVDNVIVGKPSVDEALEYYRVAKGLFNETSMNLREWCSNSKEFIEQIPEIDRAKGQKQKLLGILWDLEADTFSVPDPKLEIKDPMTKRKMLSITASFFDPLGFFSPISVQAKILLQDSWKAKLEWDETLPEQMLNRWSVVWETLKGIPTTQIDRIVGPITGDQMLQLHCFTDASERAYSCVIYLRIEHKSGGIDTYIDFAKSRLAPIKGMTMPRMELMGVVLGFRLLKFVHKELRLNIDHLYLWTDSQCVLHWIANTNKIVDRFVENRVRELRENENLSFCYVPTAKNPADIPTKGHRHFKEFDANDLWWKGPEFLGERENCWPPQIELNYTEDQLEQTEEVLLAHRREIDPPYGIEYNDYSSLKRLIRVTAWVTKACEKWKNLKGSNEKFGKNNKQLIYLKVKELQSAKQLWEKFVQQKEFADTKRYLKKGYQDSFARQLGLYLDENEIIRCTGRFQNADLPFDAKHPKLLPKKNQFTKLVIRECHENLMHSGLNQTLAQIRFEYWVLQGRRQVKNVLFGCAACIKTKGNTYKVPPPPPLPEFRVNLERPFSAVGVDYLGHLYVKGDSKVWICLFTCASTRAIHLEVVTDLTAVEFINALRRFIARRSKPDRLISDNATQFKLANINLKVLWKEGAKAEENPVLDYVAKQGIHWNFIADRAPWFGGFYERLIGSVKRSIKKTVGRKLLSLAELQTLTTEIEAIINSRPLAPVSDDIGECLTPARLLNLSPNLGLPHVVQEEDPDYMPKRDKLDEIKRNWAENQKVLNYFWTVWKNDYLINLRERNWAHATRNTVDIAPKLGTVVLIKDNLPRAKWKLGVICDLFEGPDGKCRSVNLRLANKNVICRPIKILTPLEIPSEIDSNHISGATGDENIETDALLFSVVYGSTKPWTPPDQCQAIDAPYGDLKAKEEKEDTVKRICRKWFGVKGKYKEKQVRRMLAKNRKRWKGAFWKAQLQQRLRADEACILGQEPEETGDKSRAHTKKTQLITSSQAEEKQETDRLTVKEMCIGLELDYDSEEEKENQRVIEEATEYARTKQQLKLHIQRKCKELKDLGNQDGEGCSKTQAPKTTKKTGKPPTGPIGGQGRILPANDHFYLGRRLRFREDVVECDMF